MRLWSFGGSGRRMTSIEESVNFVFLFTFCLDTLD